MTSPFRTEVADGIAELELCNPPVNAFGVDAQFALAAEIEALGRRDDVRVIIIAATGKGFFAGLDIKEMAADPSLIVPANKANYDTFAAIHLNPKPVIAAVHGDVLGGGIGIVGAADVVVAADDAYFGVPEIDRAEWAWAPTCSACSASGRCATCTSPATPSTQPRAHRLGAVERVVQRAELRPTAREIAGRMASKSPQMIGIAKRSLNGVEDGSLEDKYRWEQGFTFEAYLTGDSAEAREAFAEGREADFGHTSDE